MWLQFFLRQASEVAHHDRVLTDDQINAVVPLCDEVTWHSMRVTLLDAADKYGFEPSSTIESAYTAAQAVHVWLGATFDQKKLQCSDQPTILGVAYDLVNTQLLIKQDRKTELVDEIVSLLESRALTPRQAGKLTTVVVSCTASPEPRPLGH